jgi:solute carrier family 35 protein F1/2
MMGFVGCLFFMYTNTSLFLENSDAVVFNLSLLTSDIYAVAFSYMRTGTLAPWTYWMSFFLVCTGLTVYYRTPPVERREGEAEAEGEGEGGQKQSLSISVSVSNLLLP